MTSFLTHLPRRAFLVVMLLGSALIFGSSIEYFDFEALPAFALEKMPLRFEALWFASLRIHVASALLAFPLCLLLMTRWLQRRAVVHRWVGRLTGTLVLLLLVPSGVVLAFDAKGGSPVTVGFLLSGAIVAWFIVRGVLAARRRDLVSHRRAMGHVVAQMSVAVTSRTLMLALDLGGMDPDRAYVVALWVPVVVSCVFAELLARRSVPLSFHPLRSVERIRREIAPLALVRARAVVRPVPRIGR